jgi:predicted metal-dependent peptidase
MVDQATQKCQGHVPGHLEDAIKDLAKPVVRWRELLRQYLGKHVGNQRRTHSRRDRRHDRFGMPGISHHAAATTNVIIDTSGSVGRRELEQFFAEIDTIAGRAKVRVLQWDHAFQGFSEYRRGDWKKFKIHGRGGTDMAAPVQWLIDNKLIADVQVMLSDGYANWHDECPFPFITVLTTPEGTTDGPTWGHVVRMKIGG